MDSKYKLGVLLAVLVVMDLGGGRMEVNGLECPVCLRKKGATTPTCEAKPCNSGDDLTEALKKIDEDKAVFLGKTDEDLKKTHEHQPEEELTGKMADAAKLPFVCYKAVGTAVAEVGGTTTGEKEELKDFEFRSCGEKVEKHAPREEKYEVEDLDLKGFLFQGDLWACDKDPCFASTNSTDTAPAAAGEGSKNGAYGSPTTTFHSILIAAIIGLLGAKRLV